LSPGTALTVETAVEVEAAGTSLAGDLLVPGAARAVVLFAHGSGSSRHSPRNRQVAAGLQQAGFGTLLMDLLTVAEEEHDLRTRELRFDIPLLAQRLIASVDWLAAHPLTAELPVGAFGASTGAAAALIAAAERAERVRAVVSRGGRTDLAGEALQRVVAPVLLIAGGLDEVVVALDARSEVLLLHAERVVVPGAGHLFEEPGALDEVTRLTVDWFDRWLGTSHEAP
jgi:putative phosphoribosyl transferase